MLHVSYEVTCNFQNKQKKKMFKNFDTKGELP